MKKKLTLLVATTVAIASILSFGTIDLKEIKPENTTAKVIQWTKENNNIFVSGKLSLPGASSKARALDYLDKNSSSLQIDKTNKALKTSEEAVDDLGYTHIKFDQYIEGLKILDKSVSVHYDVEGIVTAVTGNLSNLSTVQKLGQDYITEDEALTIAKSQVKYKELTSSPTATKAAYEYNNNLYEVYDVNLQYFEPELGNWDIYVEATSGKVLDKSSKVMSDSKVTGTGVNVNGVTRTLNLTYVTKTKQYSMIDATKPMTGKISTYQTFSEYILPGDLLGSTSKNYGHFFHEAVDAHYYAGVVYDFYKKLFNRNSIDNKGMSIISTTHYGNKLNNAFWTGSQMVYGDGDGVKYKNFAVDLDIVAHEITHGVTQYNSVLGETFEAGALNESYSDVFGVLIQTYEKCNVAKGGAWKFNAADWIIGDGVFTAKKYGSFIRSLASPAASDQPESMTNFYNTYEYDDAGGIHTNSGIPNKAAYLIAKAIGMDKTAKIYYRSYTYLTKNATFKTAALALIKSAQDLYPSDASISNTIKSIFENDGVLATDSYEPNDSLAEAVAINLDTEYKSKLLSPTDVDIYKFTVKKNDAVSIDLSNLPEDYDLYLTDSTGNRLDYSNRGNTTNENIKYKFYNAGTYYIKVYSIDNWFNLSKTYSLKVNSINTVLNLTYPKATDSLTGTIKVTGLLADLHNITLKVYVDDKYYCESYGLTNDSDFTKYANMGLQGGKFSLAVNITHLSKGKHTLRIDGYDSYWDSTSTLYQDEITVDNLALKDTYEDNNSPETAKAIDFTNEFTSLLASNDESDYYSFEIEAGEHFEISLKNHFDNYNFQILDSDLVEVTSTNSQNVKTDSDTMDFEANVYSAGKYYIKISANDASANPYQYYSFKLTVVAPTAQLDYMSDNMMISGAFKIRGNYHDLLDYFNYEVTDTIDVYIDGSKIGSTTTDIAKYFSYTLDVTALTTGEHELSLVGISYYGRSYEFKKMKIRANAFPVILKYNYGWNTQAYSEAYLGDKLTEIKPEREGYTFDGWYTDSTLSTKWDFATDTVTGRTELYAKWNIIKYTITFNTLGGSAVASQVINYNEPVSYPTNPILEGYTFGSWYYDSACTRAGNFSAYANKGDTTFYAYWLKNPSAPSNLRTGRLTTTSVKLSWSKVDGATHYEVYYSTSSNGSYTLLTTTTALNYTKTGLKAKGTYYFKVRGYRTYYSRKVYSDYSTIISLKL